MQPYQQLSSVFLCLLTWLHSNLAHTYVPLQSFTGRIGGGNYTYYKLLRNGNIQIQLRSLEGDADLYVSQTALHPTFELDNFDVHSVTCGDDIVDIPESYKRPVGIGIYGHPRYVQSIFECVISVAGADATLPPANSWTPPDAEVEEESIMWTIFVNVLKVVLDILV
ncbi:UPF0669 protein C6orf120 homolog [Amphiura filiformis]|uniref:UPF0669 protein C6orf120 homolog n=1 Tax=Amphiura filiformis TaxID=82378 RepID=UPI003B21E848